MSKRWVLIAFLLVAFTGAVRGICQTASATQNDVTATPAQASLRPLEPAIDGLTRLDKGTVALTLAKQKLLLYNFEFNGDPVSTDKLHFKQLSPGVLEITSVAYTVGEWRVRIRDSANYYGLGERFDTLNHAHTVVHNVSLDNPGAKGSGTYKPVPFFMSTTGYGVWFDVTGDATFDMNASNKTDIIVDADAEKLRIVLFTAAAFPEILDDFTAQAGRSILPPYWAFAPWLGRHQGQNEEQVRQDINKARALALPSSVFLIDSPRGTGSNSDLSGLKQFTEAPGMVKHLHEAGYKLVLWNTPWINKKTEAPSESKIGGESANYAEAAAAGFFVKAADGTPYLGQWSNGTGSLIDFTNPRAKVWWQDQVRQAIHAGADGFKDDGDEGNFVGNVKFNDESDPRVMRNRCAVLYNNAMNELIQKDLKGDGVLFIRSVTSGANGLGFLWGGDNEASFSAENGLPSAVTAGLNAGLSGMPLWTADLGGHLAGAKPDPQLFMRWTEYAAFAPVMETLSWSNLLPWDYGDQALAVYRKFSTLHMSLFPYRYAAAQQAAKTGMPIMRALVLEHQDDEQARLARNEYLFGPALLVAPIVDEGTQRTVYLPQGEWLDYWTGKRFPGGHTIIAEAAIDSVPLYVRDGVILPMIPEDVMTLVPVAESGNNALKAMDGRRVYEIFGSGDSNITDFQGRTLVRSANSLTITGDEAAHILIRWPFQKIASATFKGAPVRVQTDASGPFIEFDHVRQSEIHWQ